MNQMTKATPTQIAVQIPEDELVRMDKAVRLVSGLPNAPDHAVRAITLLSFKYNLDVANKELMLISTGWERVGDTFQEKLEPYVGVSGLTRSARRQADFRVDYELVEADELQELRGNLYTENDVGVRAKLIRLDEALKWKEVGFDPPVHEAVGLWREKGTYSKKKKAYVPDPIPNTMTKRGKAEQRALRAVIRKAFDLYIPSAAEMMQESPQGDATWAVVPPEIARLMDNYSVAQIETMDDEQRRIAIDKLDMADALAAKQADMTSEEIVDAGKEAGREIWGNRRKRLGDDEPTEVVVEASSDEEPPADEPDSEIEHDSIEHQDDANIEAATELTFEDMKDIIYDLPARDWYDTVASFTPRYHQPRGKKGQVMGKGGVMGAVKKRTGDKTLPAEASERVGLFIEIYTLAKSRDIEDGLEVTDYLPMS